MLRDVAAGRRHSDLPRRLQPGSATTPLTPEARAQFAAYVAAIVREVPEIRDVIVGNEPNLNRFWLPQFDADGEDVAAPAYSRSCRGLRRREGGRRRRDAIWGGALRRAGSTGRDRP